MLCTNLLCTKNCAGNEGYSMTENKIILEENKNYYERFSLAVFVPTVSSPAPAAVPVPLGAAVRSHGDSCRSAVDSIPPSSAAEHPAPPR